MDRFAGRSGVKVLVSNAALGEADKQDMEQAIKDRQQKQEHDGKQSQEHPQ